MLINSLESRGLLICVSYNMLQFQITKVNHKSSERKDTEEKYKTEKSKGKHMIFISSTYKYWTVGLIMKPHLYLKVTVYLATAVCSVQPSAKQQMKCPHDRLFSRTGTLTIYLTFLFIYQFCQMNQHVFHTLS